MNKLPLEVLLGIFTNLDLEDLFSVSGVCVRWHCAVSRLLATKRRTLFIMREGAPQIRINDSIPDSVVLINKKNFIAPLKHFWPTLKHLFIVYDGDNDWDHTFDICECLVAALKSAANLISLNLIGSVRCTRRLITSIVQNSSDTIQSVWLNVKNNGGHHYNSSEYSELRESLHLIENQMYGVNLRETKITVAGPTGSKIYAFYNNAFLPTVDIVLTTPYNLSEIYFLNCSGLEAKAYNAIGLAMNLKTVVLKHAYSLDASGLRVISKLPCLHTLSISDAVRVTEDGWKCVFTERTSLEVLKLKNCIQLSDSSFCSDAVEAVCTNLTSLKLDLENCKQVTGAGLKALLLACAVRLNSLSLRVDYDEQTMRTIQRCVTEHLQRLSFVKVTVQTALAFMKNPIYTNLSSDDGLFVMERTKILVP